MALKHLLIIPLLTLLMTSANYAAVVVNNFDDIQLWTGNGANRAALVIDWNDNRNPLVWGYRFDTATGADMLRAIVEADSRLFAKVEDFGGTLGWFTHGLGYDRDSDGFGISSNTDFGSNGFVFSGSRSGATATDPEDSYHETDSNFGNTWRYFVGTGNNYPGAGWADATTGISGRNLSDLSWDGFGVTGAPGTAFAAVPEPNSAWLIGLGAIVCLRRKRNASVATS